MYYVYILKCLTSNELYIGYTYDLKRRMEEHNSGKSKYTKGRKWELIYYEAYKAKEDATKREYQLKRGVQQKRWLKERIKHSIKDS